MAEGYLRHFAKGQMEVYSAGIEAHGLNPRAVQVMHEDGIDISGQTSDIVDRYMSIPFDVIITVCDHAREHCPWIPGNAERIHHSFPDPAKATGTEAEIMAAFRHTRDLVREWCKKWVEAQLPA